MVHRDLKPHIKDSLNYKHWISTEDLKRCTACANNHGRIYKINETPYPIPPIHTNCRCRIETMSAITVGTATIDGINGADWNLKYEGKLPNYYIGIYEAIRFGWRPGKSPSKFVYGKMISAGIYKNFNGHLPHIDGRIWYEADINYKTGRRNSHRILWSNDGLIFVTYNHYKSFFEIS